MIKDRHPTSPPTTEQSRTFYRPDTATPAEVWKQHRADTGISRAEYDAYMDGAAQASALLLESAERLEEPVPLAHLRAGGAFHPPQSYRYIAEDALRGLVTGHAMANVLLDQLTKATPNPRPLT